jgi:glutathione S-transferase
MATVEIIGIAPSTYTRVARMACEEKGVSYELKPATPHAPEVLAIHPFGKIPVLRHGDFEVCETRALAAYIDRAFDGPALFPSNPRDLARAEQWVSLVNTVLDRTMVRTYLFGYFFPKTGDGKPDRAMIDGALPELRAQIALLDKAVKPTGHLAGDRFSFADINLMPILYYLNKLPEAADAIGHATPRSRPITRSMRSGPASRTPPRRRRHAEEQSNDRSCCGFARRVVGRAQSASGG